jgi:hypothetical protein
MSDSCSWATRHSQAGKIDDVLAFPAIETCSCAMLEIGFPAATAATPWPRSVKIPES